MPKHPLLYSLKRTTHNNRPPNLHPVLQESLKCEHHLITAAEYLLSQHAPQRNGQRALDGLFPPKELSLSRVLTQTFEMRNETKAFPFHTENVRRSSSTVSRGKRQQCTYPDFLEPPVQDQNTFLLNTENKRQRFFEKTERQL